MRLYQFCNMRDIALKSPLRNSFSTEFAGTQMMRKSLAIGAILAMAVAAKSDARRPIAKHGNAAIHPAADRLPVDHRFRAAARLLRPPVRRAEQGASPRRKWSSSTKPARRRPRRACSAFRSPNFGGLFGGGDDEVKQIASTVARVSQDRYGGWVVTLADGSTWSAAGRCAAGAWALRRATRSSSAADPSAHSILSVNGQPGIRVKRIG